MSQTSDYLPYGRQYISHEDIEEVVRVLKSPLITQGPVVSEFENAIAFNVESLFGIAVNSATSALHIACLALGLNRGDYLWTSPITFVASANCARYCGALVDFIDIDRNTGLISIDALEKQLEKAASSGTLPKIVVPVHLAGTSCDMEAIGRLSRRYGFSVIEDASHAIGGFYFGKPIGCCQYSSICIFSFHPVKIITTGEGGFASTNDPYLAQKMLDLRSHGITKDKSRFESEDAGPWVYEQQDLGFNYRMTDLQAALGLSQLRRLHAIVAERNHQVQFYRDLLKDLPVKLLSVPEDVLSSFHLAVIRFADPRPEHHRRVFDGLRAAGIGVQVHYTPVHLQPYYRKLGFREGDFPEAEAYASNAISLPLYPGLLQADQQRVAETLATLLWP